MGIINQIGQYLGLVKKDPNAPQSDWLNKMHGINRISIFVALFGLLVILLKFLGTPKIVLGILIILVVLVIGVIVYKNLTGNKAQH